jgi:rubredoxin
LLHLDYKFIKKEATDKYVCSICGYVYDPAEHDGVAFEDLPDDWKCPRCKQPKEKFNRLKKESKMEENDKKIQ